MPTGLASESFDAAEAFTAHLAAVAEHSSDAILTLDPVGTVTSWNAGAEHIYGYRADEMIGRNAASVLAPPGGEAERDALRDRLGRGESATREMDLVRADGRPITVSVTSSPILDARGRLLAVSSIARDITDQRETARLLAESEGRYRNLADTATDIVARISPATGRLLYVSPSVEDILGWTPEQLVGRPYTDFVDPEAVATLQIDEVLGTAGTHTRNGVHVRRRDGTWAWCDITSRTVVDPISGDLEIRSSARDVTARRRDEVERETAATRLFAENVELVDAGRMKDHVLAVTNHELRTPLAAIVGFSDLLSTEWQHLSEAERLDFVERIHESGLRMAKLVDDFLLAVALASGTLSIAAVTAELRPVLDTALTRAGTRAAEIAVACPPGLRVIADPDRLAQILASYLTNAARYGGGPVSIEAVQAGDFVEIRVHDHGPGVPPELLPSLFDSFGDASRVTDRTSRGTGLGLAIAKGLARAQGGDAWYEPDQPSGATFAVRIPASP